MAIMDENGGNGMVMPVAPMYGGSGNGNNGWGGDWGWIILLILLAGGGWGNGFGGGFGNNALSYDFPWVLNGQNGINNNVSDGFRSAALSDGITSIRDGINGISTQLCNGFAGVNSTINGAQNAIAQQLYANQIADMQSTFGLQSQLAQCCCDNRLANADLKYTIATENCADRAALSDGIRDIVAAQTAGTQRILDQLCADKIDSKNDTIAQLRQELMFARGQASQDVQTAAIRAGQVAEVDALYNRLSACPVPTMPVYGMQPIFTCNNGCGCGCNG